METPDFQAKSEYFGGYDYLRRLNELLTGFNAAFINDDVDTMYSIILGFYQELYCYLSEKERNNAKKTKKEIQELRVLYLKETDKNRQISVLLSYYYPKKVDTAQKEKLMYALINWRIELQDCAKKAGLVMLDKPDPKRAMLEG